VRPAGGLVIAFVGIDGSGKSTLVKEVCKWLQWKIDVYPIYFGSGDGKSTFYRYPLKKIFKFIKKRPAVHYEVVRKKGLFVRSVWALTLALEKKRTFRNLWRARCRGLLVICDRYPQNQIDGINDGPLLSDWFLTNNPVKRAVAKWEIGVYSLADIYHPDIVFMLNPSPEAAYARKPEAPLAAIKRKSMLLQQINYHKHTGVYKVNTERPMSESLLEIKRIIAKNL